MLVARLEGGPYCGAEEPVDDFPPEVNAFACPGCGEIHIVPLGAGPPDESYKYDRMSSSGAAVYIYGEFDLDDDVQNKERDKEPALN